MKILPVSETALHLQYPREGKPQPCFLELDPRDGGTLSAAPDPEIGGSYPSDVGLGHILRWPIQALRAAAATALFVEVTPLAERVIAGYGTRWGGNNILATYSEDAREAGDAIERLCEMAGGEGASLVVWQATDWYGASGDNDDIRRELSITRATTNEELEALAKRELALAAPDVDVIAGLGAYLVRLRDGAPVVAEPPPEGSSTRSEEEAEEEITDEQDEGAGAVCAEALRDMTAQAAA